MGWFSNILAQKASATAKPGQGGGGDRVGWQSQIVPQLVQQLIKQGKLPAPQRAAPAAPASDIEGSIRRNLALTNLNPFQYATGGGYGAGGGGITGLPQYAAATAQQQNLAQQQRALQIAAQNQAAAVPVGAVPELYRKSPKPAGPFYIGSDKMNAWLASQGIGPVIAHAGGFVHQHPLPGERILR